MFTSNAALRVKTALYRWLDRLYLPLDRQLVRRTRNLRLLPEAKERVGGKFSYAEWAHVVGIFQTLFWLHLEQKADNQILDVGCGTGLLGIAAEPFLGTTGCYLGMDVSLRDLAFCRSHYPSPPFEFVHLDVNNPFYAPNQAGLRQPWPFADDRFDLASALSVWTHFNEEDAVFYFAELARVLKPGAKAIVTVFLLDSLYFDGLGRRAGQQSRFHTTSPGRWIFDQPVNGSDAWFHPGWAAIPENAIGVTPAGLNRLIECARLALVAHYQGNWKEVPGVFFQDILVFEKEPGKMAVQR